MATIPYDQLQPYIMKIIKEVIEEVGYKINELMRENVDKYVYQAGNQTNYYANGTMQPTFELRDSIRSSKATVSGNQAEVTIAHNTDFMSVEPDEFIHGSNYWKTYDIRELLPEIINYGLSGDFFGSGWWQKPRPYFDKTLEELRDQGKLRQWFIEGLQKRGLKVVK